MITLCYIILYICYRFYIYGEEYELEEEINE